MGEMTGGGDSHGVLADFSSIAWSVGSDSSREETVNYYIEDSKTGFCRDFTTMGVTKGPLAVRCADNLRELWRLSGFKIVSEVVDGMHVEHPDYKVVRVSLLDMNEHTFRRLLRVLSNTDAKFMADRKGWVTLYAKERYFKMELGGATVGSETLSKEERYLNIAGGEAGCSEIIEAEQLCEAWGFKPFVNVVRGPLLRATVRGNVKQLTHMPLKPGSTYAHVPKALLAAWEKNQKDGIVDTEIDLEGRDKPRFGNHGDRRYADKIATDTKHITGVTDGDIDDFFGWQQKMRRKISQLHYHGRKERWLRAKVTMMV